jgi:prepilin-type N-terminal cleavage/methylation domain-containing protein
VRDTGVSLPELLVGLVILTIVMGFAGFVAVPRIVAESARGTIHDAGMLLQRTKAEALSRNHDCRFVVDVGQRTMTVLDGNGTGMTSDDRLVAKRTIPAPVGIARPDSGPPITFAPLSASTYEVVFDSAGRVDSGAGEMVVYGGGHYRRLTVYGAGGVRFERWNGSGWTREY